MTDLATARHESAHLVALLMFCPHRKIELARVDWPTATVAGRVETSIVEGGELGPVDLVAHLVGWLVDEDECPHEWPPPWPVAEDELDSIGKLVRILKLREDQYAGLVEVAEDLVADEGFQAAVNLYARGFGGAPVLDSESVQILREVAIPKPEEGAAL